MIILLVLLALSTVEVVKSCKVAADTSVVVVSNFVIDVVLCNVVVEILEVRSAYECAPESVYLSDRIFHTLLSRAVSCTVVRLSSVAVAVTNDIGVTHRVVTEDIFHLSLCPREEYIITSGLSVNTSTETSSGVITSGTIAGNNCPALGRLSNEVTACFTIREIRDLIAGHRSVPEVVVHTEVLVTVNRFIAPI